MCPHLGHGPPWPWLVILPQEGHREQGGDWSFQMHMVFDSPAPSIRVAPSAVGRRAGSAATVIMARSSVGSMGPEVAGDGAGAVRVTTEGIDTTSVVRALASDTTGKVGAVVSFTGVVRADRLPRAGGEVVTELEFECYPEMAEAELLRIRLEAIERFALSGLTVIHRTGRLRVGEEIVLVSAAARHRQAAFEAAAWVMDRIKERVPLWKRELGDAGGSRWVEGRRSVV